MTNHTKAMLRSLPSVNLLLSHETLAGLAPADVKTAAAFVLDHLRLRIRGCDASEDELSIEAVVAAVLAQVLRTRKFVRVINATGIILHTNLGRAPLAKEAARAAYHAALCYTNLEIDTHSGKRASRHDHVDAALSRLTGAAASMIVNNNAAAVMLSVAILAPGEVLVSRGELVEIGGSFRVPDVLTAAGVTLVEVGTTNRTHVADYARAITPSTRAILRISPSNFYMRGFVSRPSARELAVLAHSHGLLFLDDLGSGSLLSLDGQPSTVALAARHADVLTFSADKELGGPQAGIAVGSSDIIAKMKAHPLARAFRIDKLSLAALSATLEMYTGGRAMKIPVQQMLCASSRQIHRRACRLATFLTSSRIGRHTSSRIGRHTSSRIGVLAPPAGVCVQVVKLRSLAGGGAAPGNHIASWGVSLICDHMSADKIAAAFRQYSVPIIGRIHKDRFIIDVRTLFKRDFDEIARCFVRVFCIDGDETTVPHTLHRDDVYKQGMQ